MATSSRCLEIRDRIPLGLVRKAMARGMKASVTTAALSQISREVDVHMLGELRSTYQAATGQKVSLNTLLMAAVAHTLPRHPLLNAELQDDLILTYAAVNLGMAVAVPDGLIVAVVPDAHLLPLDALAAAIDDRARRARAGKLKLSDIEGGTFTVSNLGMYGVDTGVPIPRPPESAILLAGAVRPRPVVYEGQVAVRDVCWLSLSYDHRFIDGATAAAFLQDLQALFFAPESLLAAPAPVAPDPAPER
jgi:pyruvate dehydrogenase E2 component (dihydrolipoamide acetyltransferase)